MVVGDPARLRELHVRDARAALEAEDGRARMRRARPDARDRQRDQPRLRVGPVLGHDQRAAVGGVAALLRAVVARMQGQLAGLRPGRDGDRVAGRRRTAGTRARAPGSRSSTSPTIRAAPRTPLRLAGAGPSTGRLRLVRRPRARRGRSAAATRATPAGTSSGRRAASSTRAAARRGRSSRRSGSPPRARRRTA